MAIQLIPFAIGAAMASATVYILKDAALRHSIASQGLAGLSAIDEQAASDSSPPEQQAPQPAIEPEQASSALSVDDMQAAPDTTAAEQQTPQSAVEPEPEPEQESAALSADDAQAASDRPAVELQAPGPVQQPDQHRCAAKTKAGHRCRSKTHVIVSMPQEAGGVAEVALCSVHSRIYQQGGTVALVDLREKI